MCAREIARGEGERRVWELRVCVLGREGEGRVLELRECARERGRGEGLGAKRVY